MCPWFTLLEWMSHLLRVPFPWTRNLLATALLVLSLRPVARARTVPICGDIPNVSKSTGSVGGGNRRRRPNKSLRTGMKERDREDIAIPECGRRCKFAGKQLRREMAEANLPHAFIAPIILFRLSVSVLQARAS